MPLLHGCRYMLRMPMSRQACVLRYPRGCWPFRSHLLVTWDCRRSQCVSITLLLAAAAAAAAADTNSRQRLGFAWLVPCRTQDLTAGTIEGLAGHCLFEGR